MNINDRAVYEPVATANVKLKMLFTIQSNASNVERYTVLHAPILLSIVHNFSDHTASVSDNNHMYVQNPIKKKLNAVLVLLYVKHFRIFVM